MPRGDKTTYTAKQKRQAEHIESGYKRHGVEGEEAARRAWATVNKTTGGGRKGAAKKKRGSRSSKGRSSSSRKKKGSSRRSSSGKK